MGEIATIWPESLIPRVSRLVIVLTAMEREKGHPSYHSKSLYPAKGRTVGDTRGAPRRQRAHDAPACHAARRGTAQRDVGLPGGRDLAHRVLSLANTLRALWARRVASPAPSGPTGSAAPDHAADRAADPGRGAGVAHVGLRTDRRPPGPRVRTARGPGDCATAPAPFRPAAPPGSPGAARAPQCRDLWAAHRADAAAARPSARRPESARARHPARRTGLPRHLLHWQAQGRGQGLAGHGLRRRLLLRGGVGPARTFGRGHGELRAPDPGPALPTRRMAAAADPHRWRVRVQGRRCRGLPGSGDPAHTHLAAPRLDQWLR